MSEPVLLLVVMNFLFVGLLPKVFFKKDGRFNLMWWLTALPFVLSTALMLAAYAGYLPVLKTPVWSRLLDLAAVTLSTGSIALLFLTLGTHRIPIALWHQSNDAPQEIVTYGAYRRIRHPFYASFILAFMSAFVYCPHSATFFSLLYGILILNFTAAREEKQLIGSVFGGEYEKYMRRTGRFLPRLRAGSEYDA